MFESIRSCNSACVGSAGAAVFKETLALAPLTEESNYFVGYQSGIGMHYHIKFIN